MKESYMLLEQELADWIGSPNVVVVNSGTAALHLALECLRLPQGSRVICPDFTMIACARAITMAGLVPVFVDCDDRLLMDLDNVDDVLSNQPASCAEGVTCKVHTSDKLIKAIMPVHVYGRQVDMGAVTDLAMKYELCVVEDLAEAHGVKPHPHSDAACYSFYKNKIIAGEEGGCIAFHDAEPARLARKLRNLGFTDAHDFNHVPRGMNYRLANSLAQLIRSSLHYRNQSISRRAKSVELLDRLCPAEWKMPPRQVDWVYDLRVPGMTSLQQDEVVRRLNQVEGVICRHFFKPLRRQPEYMTSSTDPREWKSDSLSREGVYFGLPVSEDSARAAFEALRQTLDLV